MFCIKILVACSVLVIFSASASAAALSASATAWRSLLLMLSSPMIVANNPVPNIRLRISLQFIVLIVNV